MNPKYCVSLETAKRLKELGFPQNTDFYWVEFNAMDRDGTYWTLMGKKQCDSLAISQYRHDLGLLAAPHSGELGEWMYEESDYGSGYMTKKTDYGWRVYKKVWGQQIIQVKELGNFETEAEARANCLIYLAENGLIDPKAL